MSKPNDNLIADMTESGISMSGVRTQENVVVLKPKRAMDDIFVKGGNPIAEDARRLKAAKQAHHHSAAQKRIERALRLIECASDPWMHVQLIDEPGFTGFRVSLPSGEFVSIVMSPEAEGA